MHRTTGNGKETFADRSLKKMPLPPEKTDGLQFGIPGSIRDTEREIKEITDKEKKAFPSELSVSKEKEAEKQKIIQENLLAKKQVSLPTPKKSETEKSAPGPKQKESINFLWSGECLVYEVNWNFVTIGTALMCCQEEKTENGNVYHIIAITIPQGAFAKMGYGYNRVDSFINKETLQPYSYYSYFKNGQKALAIEIQFNNKEGKFSWTRKKFKKDQLYSTTQGEIIHKEPVYDTTSAFYLLRTFNFDEKQNRKIPIGLTKIWDLFVRLVEKKKVDVPLLGEREVDILEPEAKTDNAFFTKGKMTMWLTTDEKRIPVYLVGKVPLGTGKLSLIKQMQLSPETQINNETLASILNLALNPSLK